MADICEICWKPIGHYEGGDINYEGYCLCIQCCEKIEELCDDDSNKVDRLLDNIKKDKEYNKLRKWMLEVS